MRNLLVVQVLAMFVIGGELFGQSQRQDSVYTKKWTTNVEINRGGGLGSISTSLGRFENNLKAYQLRLSQTYDIGEETRIGGGIGYDRYGNISMLPIFGELRTNISTDKKAIPYVIGRLGYSIGRTTNEGINGRDLGGTMWQMGLGISFKVNHYQAINISFNLFSQQFRFDYFNRQGVVILSENVNHNFLTLGIGYSF